MVAIDNRRQMWRESYCSYLMKSTANSALVTDTSTSTSPLRAQRSAAKRER